MDVLRAAVALHREARHGRKGLRCETWKPGRDGPNPAWILVVARPRGLIEAYRGEFVAVGHLCGVRALWSHSSLNTVRSRAASSRTAAMACLNRLRGKEPPPSLIAPLKGA